MKFINTEKRSFSPDCETYLSETCVLLIKADVTFCCLRTNWGYEGESTDQTKVTLVESTRSICYRILFALSLTYIPWTKRALIEYPLDFFFLKRHILKNRLFHVVTKVKTKASLLVEREEFCVSSSLWYEIKDKENTRSSIIGNLGQVMAHLGQVSILSYWGGLLSNEATRIDQM